MSEEEAGRIIQNIYPNAKGPLWVAVARALDEAEFNTKFHEYLDDLI